MVSTQRLWFISRGSGLVLLMLFTAVVVLGTATRLGWAPPRWPRFVAAELHRSLALFAVALLGLHVVTAIADPYVSIGWAATAIPFLSPYRTAAVGLGTLAVDLAGAVLLTSLVRHRLGLRAWRAVHWLAYLAWPAAFGHALSAGGDLAHRLGRSGHLGIGRHHGNRGRRPPGRGADRPPGTPGTARTPGAPPSPA